jgi:recombination protein RecA
MARQKKNTETNENDEETVVETTTKENTTPKNSIMANFIKNSGIKGLENASTLDVSKLSNITEWISTGSYSLNKVISGNVYKGIPRGRITCLCGPSGAGKTFVCGNIIREAQKDGWTIAYLDSENAVNREFMERIGVFSKDIGYVTVKTINQLKFTAVEMMRKFKEMYPNEKLLIVIDSIGGLVTEKELEDQIEEKNTAMDMGLRAKQLRVLAKLLTIEAAENQVAILATNHTYDQPAQNPNAAPTTVMGGGQGFVYASSLVIVLKKHLEREEQKNLDSGKTEKVVTGVIFTATTEKNRQVPQGLKAQIYVSFEAGLNRWYGLLEDALKYGIIKVASAQFYELPNGDKVRRKDIYKRAVWEPIIDDLNKKIEENVKFATFIDPDKLDLELNSGEKEITTPPIQA